MILTFNTNKSVFSKTLIIMVLLVLTNLGSQGQTITISNGAEIYVAGGATLTVSNGVKIESGGSLTHDSSDSTTVRVSGKFDNEGTYSQNGLGTLIFYENLEDTIAGAASLTFERIHLRKSDSTKKVSIAQGTDVTIEDELRLISANLFDINASDLTIEWGAQIYPDSNSNYWLDPLVDPFTESRHITSNGTFNSSGNIIRKIDTTGTLNNDLFIRFPLGTANDTTNPTEWYYSPARYSLAATMTNFKTDAQMKLRVVAAEHPAVLVSNVSLKKYWIVESDSIDVDAYGYNIRFDYNDNEVQGDEEEYLLCLFYRSNTYFINKGTGYGVEPINNRFRVDEVYEEDQGGILQLDGDWTAGQEESVSNFFYSRQDGDWDDSNTWSQEGYGGAAANAYPQTVNDIVFIGDNKTVALNSTNGYVKTVNVDTTGRLNIFGQNTFVQGDSLFVRTGGRLGITSTDGISNLPNMTGNVRTDSIRSYSQDGIYIYMGDENQNTGLGIPNIVGSLVVENTGATDSTVSLSKSIEVKDSLIVNSGRLHLFGNGNFTANGATGDTTNRFIRMRGGELFCQSFPKNYKAPEFEFGTVNFGGTGSFRIPSSTIPTPGEPAVIQYNNLKVTGSRGPNTFITLDPSGEIRIGGNLDISQLSFNPNPLSDRFIVTGSDVVFNGDSTQEIQTGYPSPEALEYRLKFHDLSIRGSGDKIVQDPNDSDPNDDYLLVRNNLSLESGNLVANDFDIEVLNSWVTTPGATFDAGNGEVTFVADGKVTNITSSGVVFNDLRIQGTLANGFVNYLDSLTVSGTLNLDPVSFRDLNSTALTLLGDFNINGGEFIANNGRVYFKGDTNQKFNHNGLGRLYNITVDKSGGDVLLDGDSLIAVDNNLELISRNIGGRNSDSVSKKPILVDGTITRPGANPGHIDGRLRLYFGENADTNFYPVGIEEFYNPVEFVLNGFGGTPGYLDATCEFDTLTTNIDRTVLETDTPDGAALDSTKNIRRTWFFVADPTLPVNQRWKLGAARSFSIQFFYNEIDTIGRGNPLNYEIRRRLGPTNPGAWERLETGFRGPLTMITDSNATFPNDIPQYYVLGEPKVFTYYSISDGNFSDSTNWTTAGWGNSQTATRPPASFDNIRIGDGYSITLDVNHTVDTDRYFSVETDGPSNQNGELILGTNIISGAGEFRLDSGGAIRIGDPNGIVSSGSSGNIRTSIRNFNYNNHNRGHFYYNASASQVVGSGLPNTVATLNLEIPAGQSLTFPGSVPSDVRIYQVIDSIYVRSGELDIGNIITKLAGNIRFDSSGTFESADGTSNDYRLTRPWSTTGANTASEDSTEDAGAFIFNGFDDQYIWKDSTDTNLVLNFNRISLSNRNPDAKIISRNNLQCAQLFFHPVNRSNLDVASWNKYTNVYTPSGTYNVLRVGRGGGSEGDPGFDSLSVAKYGWVEGRLIRFSSSNDGRRIMPVGTGVKYAPVEFNRNQGGCDGCAGGLVEVQAVEGNHPLFDSTEINQNTNIQRYYEFTLPNGLTPNFVLGDREFRARFIFTEDEPRGGIDPSTDFFVFRLQDDSTWTNSQNMSTQNRTDTELWGYMNNPSLNGNNLFEASSVFTGAPSITVMIGEPIPSAQERVFYSKQSGPWTDPNSWNSTTVAYEDTEIGYGLDTNEFNDYPKFNDGSFKDIVYIGAGDSIYYDTSAIDLRFVQLENTASGMGILTMAGENYFETEQFVQKNGARLEIGSVDGIFNSSTSTGNIRQEDSDNIINYNWNALNISNFAFVGDDGGDVISTGPAFPDIIDTLIINTVNNNDIVNLQNDSSLTIKGDLIFKNGRFRHLNDNRDLILYGNIVNDSRDNAHDGNNNIEVIFRGGKDQYIRGTNGYTDIDAPILIDKDSNDIIVETDLYFRRDVTFNSNTYLEMLDTTVLSAHYQTSFSSTNGDFGSNRSILLSGGPNAAEIRKIFPAATNQSRGFNIPVSEDSLGARPVRYSRIYWFLNSYDFVEDSYVSVQMRSEYPHPNAPFGSAEILQKYWSLNSSGVSLRSNSTLDVTMRYNDSEVTGEVLDYAPALYRRADITPEDPGWSFRLFNANVLNVDTTNKEILIEGAVTLPNHDFTMANPDDFNTGRKYWSIGSGDWSDPNNWTGYDNSGDPHNSSIPGLNYPGFFANDTVFIGDNHVIDFNINLENSIDSLGIGVTTPSTSPELNFASVADSNKTLVVNNSVNVGATGLISKTDNSVTSRDTIEIGKNLNNDGNAGRGLDLRPDLDQTVNLQFFSANDSYVTGEGNYNSLATVQVLKADSVYNFFNQSSSFSTEVTNSIAVDPSIEFLLDAGMYYHDNPGDITLRGDGDGPLFLGDLVGLTINDGNLFFNDGLICGQNASVWLVDGNMYIGNDKDENFEYESTTIIDISGGSLLEVAGNFRRRFLTSNNDFRLKDSATIRVLTKGATTNTSERRGGFDFGESTTQFTMSGGTIEIVQPMDTSAIGEKDPDYIVNSETFDITGGKVIIGDVDSTFDKPEFLLISSVPFWDLDVINTYGKELRLGAFSTPIRNDLFISDSSIFSLNGQNLLVGGDVTIDGTFKTGTSGNRRFVMNGDNTGNNLTQTLRIKDNSAGDNFYDFVISKPDSGVVILDTSATYLNNSSPIIRNTLEFSSGNLANIIADTTKGMYIQVGTSDTNFASIQRFGDGHVAGELRRWVNNGAQLKEFPVGTPEAYTPATFETTSGTGTPGLVSVLAYGDQHPDTGNNGILEVGSDVDRYWRVVPSLPDSFALGSGRTFSLTTQFLAGTVPNGDIKSGANFGVFEHFRRTKAWPDTGSWYPVNTIARTDSSTKSNSNSTFGDFTVGEPAGLTYYSRVSGPWNSASTWSTAGYGGAAASQWPNNVSDRVFIGDGDTVTVSSTNPRPRTVTVEKFNGQPGMLFLKDERYLRGFSFELKDSAIIATDDPFGFTELGSVSSNIGSIRTTNARVYGKGTVVYKGQINQATGNGPKLINKLVVDNTGLNNNRVSFTNSVMTIIDTLLVSVGKLSLGTGIVTVQGEKVVEPGTRVIRERGKLIFGGTGDQYYVLNDTNDSELYDLEIDKPSGKVIIEGAGNADVRIYNSLIFDTTNVGYIDTRTNERKIRLMFDTTDVFRNGQGHVDGILQKQTPAVADSFRYHLGFGSEYLPIDLILTAGGTAGAINGIAFTPVPFGGGRLSPTNKVDYYWELFKNDSSTIGAREANVRLIFPPSEINNINTNEAILRRAGIPTEIPNWTERKAPLLTFDSTAASVTITNPANYFAGIGRFYVGEKYYLTFYSRQSGPWNDSNTWTLDSSHTGVAVTSGEFPNPSADDIEDNVYVGLDHIVTFNVDTSFIDTLVVRNTSALYLDTNYVFCAECDSIGDGLFALQDSATIGFGGTNQPDSTVLIDFDQYQISPDSYIEFTGTQDIDPTPFREANYINNLRVSGVGEKRITTLTRVEGNVIIMGPAEFNIDTGTLQVRRNIINTGHIILNDCIELGQ
jgi:hypothetical protein